MLNVHTTLTYIDYNLLCKRKTFNNNLQSQKVIKCVNITLENYIDLKTELFNAVNC